MNHRDNSHSRSFTALLHIALCVVMAQFSSCQYFKKISSVDVAQQKSAYLKIDTVVFSPDSKTMTVPTLVCGNVGAVALSDTNQVRINIYETNDIGERIPEKVQPRLKKIRNQVIERIDSCNAGVMLLVDLNLPQPYVSKMADIARALKIIFCHENLYVSFIKGGGELSETMLLTDYALQEYFISCEEEETEKYLYQGLLSKLGELSTDSSSMENIRHKSILLLSDGVVWNYDHPMDPNHFTRQQQLQELAQELGSRVPLFYSYLGEPTNENKNSALQVLCRKTGGGFYGSFTVNAFLDDICRVYGLGQRNMEYTVEHPDGMLFIGQPLNVHVECLSGDSVILSGKYSYSRGTMYMPIYLNGVSYMEYLIRCIVLTILAIVLCYGIFQIIVPFIRYGIFRKRYMVKYAGSEMIVRGKMVADTCYLCKSPFAVGDDIVACCEHTMHRECWDENEYHCPEYSGHCKEGSHYYNQRSLFDPRNAVYFMRWIIMGILATLCAEIVYHIIVSYFHVVDFDNPYCYRMPVYAFVLGFFITFFLSSLIDHSYSLGRRIRWAFLRGLVAGIAGYFIFMSDTLICMSFHIQRFHELLGMFSWIMLTVAIILVLTFRTRVKLRYQWFLVAILAGVIGNVVLSLTSLDYYVDYRGVTQAGTTIYSIAVSIAVACVAPRMEHFVLNIEGPVKTTEIALYKWFRAAPSKHVTIGKSVDCDLQMSWDIQGDVAPLQAEIKMKGSGLFLIACEQGVYHANGTPLETGRAMNLYHGTSFYIGATKFTFFDTRKKRV